MEHYPVPSLGEQAAAQKVSGVTVSTKSCDFVLASYEVGMAEFLAWNHSLRGMKPCMLQRGFSHCAANVTDEGGGTTTGSSSGNGGSVLPMSKQLVIINRACGFRE